jgi:hypothetical protein
MVFAASTIVVSGVTDMTGRVMIWWARIGRSPNGLWLQADGEY